jgi:hypothetical protein
MILLSVFMFIFERIRSITPSLLLKSRPMSYLRCMIAPILAHRAIRLAFKEATPQIERSDWELLACLYEAKKWVTFNFIYNEFNKRGKPCYNRWKSWYYAGLERLVAHGYISATISGAGWRRWQITIQGRVEMDKINEAAIKILMDQAKEP